MEKWTTKPSFEALQSQKKNQVQCTIKDEKMSYKTKFWKITISHKKPQVPNCKNILQKHIANIVRGVEPHCQKRLCPCAIVVCLYPQHTPILIHIKQTIQSGIKPKNKNHNLTSSSNNATTNFKFWSIHIPQRRPKAPSRNLKPYSTFQFHKPLTIALHVKHTKLLHEAINFQGIFKPKCKNPWNEQPWVVMVIVCLHYYYHNPWIWVFHPSLWHLIHQKWPWQLTSNEKCSLLSLACQPSPHKPVMKFVSNLEQHTNEWISKMCCLL